MTVRGSKRVLGSLAALTNLRSVEERTEARDEGIAERPEMVAVFPTDIKNESKAAALQTVCVSGVSYPIKFFGVLLKNQREYHPWMSVMLSWRKRIQWRSPARWRGWLGPVGRAR